MRKYITLFLLMGFCIAVFSQTPAEEIAARMNYVFAKVNRNNVSTGLLSNYGIQPIPLEYYNGVPADSNFVDLSSYKLLYAGVYSSKFNDRITLITPDELSTRINNYSSGTSIPVSVMHYQYNRLIEMGVERGLVSVTNDQVMEIAGKNPYETANLFAATPKEVEVEGTTVSFVFPSALRVTNVNKVVQSVQVRFDESLAYRDAGWDSPISHTYPTDGIKKVRFKIIYADGSSFVSQTNIAVQHISQTIAGGTRAAGPGDAAGSAGASYDIAVAANSSHSGGTIQVKLASNNTTGKIKKALVVAEGFDVSPKLGQTNINLNSLLHSYNDLGINYYSPNIYNAIQSDYDIVYVDNNNGTDDIRRNAALFMEALEKINSPAYKIGSYPNVVMGISMGGLVARHALRKMEMQNKNHNTWKYISVDSPHKGANIPVGFQAAANHIGGEGLEVFFITALKSTWFSDDLKDAVEILSSPAAKQMLIYRSDKSFFNLITTASSYNNMEHNAFLQEYDQMGFPQKCQNIAVSNGRADGQNLFAPGSVLFQYNEKFSLKWWMETLNVLLGSGLGSGLGAGLSSLFFFSNHPEMLLNIIPGKSQIGVGIEINALNVSGSANVYHGNISFHKKIFWLINSKVTLAESTLKREDGMLPLDGAQGGIYDVASMGGSAISPYADNIKEKKFSFIPTVSALALNDWKSKLTSNLHGQNFFAQGITDFEYISYSGSASEIHTTFNSSSQFIINQLKDKPISPNAFSSAFCGSKNVTINNPQSVPIAWSVSDNLFGIATSTNTSAAITSAPMVRSAVLSIASTNTYPLLRRLVSVCNLSITGPSTICMQDEYKIEALPSGATVQWILQNGAKLGFEVITNGNKARIAALPSAKYGDSLILKADITLNNNSRITCSKTIETLPKKIVFVRDVFVIKGSASHPPMLAVYPRSNPLIPIDPSICVPGEYRYFFNRYPAYGFKNGQEYEITYKDVILARFEINLVPYPALKRTGTIGVVFRPSDPSLPSITGECTFFLDPLTLPAFTLSPNPATTLVTIQLEEETPPADMLNNNVAALDVNKPRVSGVCEIQLWNAASLLRTYKTDRLEYQISVSDLPRGIYFVRVIKNGETYTQKLLKE